MTAASLPCHAVSDEHSRGTWDAVVEVLERHGAIRSSSLLTYVAHSTARKRMLAGGINDVGDDPRTSERPSGGGLEASLHSATSAAGRSVYSLYKR